MPYKRTGHQGYLVGKIVLMKSHRLAVNIPTGQWNYFLIKTLINFLFLLSFLSASKSMVLASWQCASSPMMQIFRRCWKKKASPSYFISKKTLSPLFHFSPKQPNAKTGKRLNVFVACIIRPCHEHTRDTWLNIDYFLIFKKGSFWKMKSWIL